MQIIKIDKPKKEHTFPCVLENIGSGQEGCRGLIIFCYEQDSKIIGVVLNQGNHGYPIGYYANNWTVDTHPHHWVSVNIMITHGDKQ